MAGEDYIIKVIRDINELEVLEKELEGFRQRELDSDRALYKMKLQETEKYVAREKALIKELNQSIKDGVQTNKNAGVVKQQSNLTGQSTQLESIDALKQQITHYTQLRDKVLTTSPEFTNLDTKVRSLTQAKKDLLTQTKLNSSSFLEFGKNLAELKDGLTSAFSGLYNFGKEAVTSAARVQVLKENLKLTEEEFQLLKTAAAGSLSEQELLPLVSYGKQIGLTTNEIAQFISTSEQLNDKGIGDTASNFKTLAQAILTNGNGLETLGISQKEYNEKLEKTAKSLGLTVEKTKGLNGETEISIKGLDAEKQALLNKMTLINGGYVHSLEEAKNKQVDVADKLDLVRQKLEEAKVEAGSFMLNALEPLINKFLEFDKGTLTTIGLIGQIGNAFLGILPAISQTKIAFGNFSMFALGKIGLVIAAVTALAAVFSKIQEYQDRIDQKGHPYDPNLKSVIPFEVAAFHELVWSEELKYDDMRKHLETFRKRYSDDQLKQFELWKYFYPEKKGRGDVLLADKELYEQQKIDEDIKSAKDALDEAIKKSAEDTKKDTSGSIGNMKTNSFDNELAEIRAEIEYAEKNFRKSTIEAGRTGKDGLELLGDFYNKKLDELEATKNLNENEEERNKILEIQNEIISKNVAKIKEAVPEERFTKAYKGIFLGEDVTGGNAIPFNREATSQRIDEVFENPSETMQAGLSNKITDDLSLILSTATEVSNTLNLGSHTFVSQLINGLNTAIGLVSSILNLFNNLTSGGGGLFSFLGGLLSFLPGGSALSAVANAVGAFGGRRAEGGEVSLGKSYLVGEKGMELFVPRTNGFIFSNKELMKMASNGQNRGISNVMNNIYLNASVNSELIVTKGLKAMNQSNRYKKVA